MLSFLFERVEEMSDSVFKVTISHVYRLTDEYGVVKEEQKIEPDLHYNVYVEDKRGIPPLDASLANKIRKVIFDYLDEKLKEMEENKHGN